MKVILQQDVKGKGKRGQMVEVSDGYARNFLLPKKLAVEATSNNLNVMKLQEKARLAQIAKEKEEAAQIAKQLEQCVVKIPAKAGESGKLFGSVTSKEISDALSAQFSISIEKQKIVLPESIKAFGTYEVKCRLGYEITGKINVVVSELK